MRLFGNENSIEPGSDGVARKARSEQPVIREATGAELAGATQRRDRATAAEAKTPPVVEVRAAPQRASRKVEEPDAVARRHNLYTADRRSTRVYYNDYQQKSEVMRASPAKITTKLDDRQTVTAMLDLAQARGWDTVKLRGTDAFKREVWVQAQERGIATEGYKPKATDVQEATRRQTAAAPVQNKAEARAAEAPKPASTQKADVQRQDGVAIKAVPVRVENANSNAGSDGTRKQRAAEGKAVWGSVENVGRQAREIDTAKQTEKPTAVARSKVASEAA